MIKKKMNKTKIGIVVGGAILAGLAMVASVGSLGNHEVNTREGMINAGPKTYTSADREEDRSRKNYITYFAGISAGLFGAYMAGKIYSKNSWVAKNKYLFLF